MFAYDYWGSGTFSAAANMALEEFMLEQAKRRASIRFFDFARDSVVLGYAQHPGAVRNAQGIDVARRLTGGSHVHVGGNVFCYSFAVPRDGTFRTYEDMRAYYAQCVADALASLGIGDINIDNKASTINVNGRVVASHAVIWGVESALLHGLVIIDPYDADVVADRVFLASRKIGSKDYTEYAALKNIPVVSMLMENTAKNVAPQRRSVALKKRVAEAILRQVATEYQRKQIAEPHILQAHAMQKHKYASELWTGSRKPPFTSDDIDEIPGETLRGALKRGLGYCLYSQVKDRDFRRMAEE